MELHYSLIVTKLKYFNKFTLTIIASFYSIAKYKAGLPIRSYASTSHPIFNRYLTNYK